MINILDDKMNETEIQYHLAAVQGSLPLVQSYLAPPNNVVTDCVDEVRIFLLIYFISKSQSESVFTIIGLILVVF